MSDRPQVKLSAQWTADHPEKRPGSCGYRLYVVLMNSAHALNMPGSVLLSYKCRALAVSRKRFSGYKAKFIPFWTILGVLCLLTWLDVVDDMC